MRLSLITNMLDLEQPLPGANILFNNLYVALFCFIKRQIFK
jgi:hypothetical protein